NPINIITMSKLSELIQKLKYITSDESVKEFDKFVQDFRDSMGREPTSEEFANLAFKFTPLRLDNILAEFPDDFLKEESSLEAESSETKSAPAPSKITGILTEKELRQLVNEQQKKLEADEKTLSDYE